MSRILVPVTPAPGHVNPLLILAEELKRLGHEVIVHTSDVFQEKIEALGLRFIPLQGKANFDYRLFEEIWPERNKTEPGLKQLNFDFENIFGSLIPDQFAGMLKIIDEENIDLVLTDICFLGVFPLISGAFPQRPPVITCGIIPYWLLQPEVSPFAGPDSTAEGLVRNAEHNRMFIEALQGSTASINQILKGYGASSPLEFPLDAACTLPDKFLQFTAEEFEYPIAAKPKNLQFVGPVPAKTVDKTEDPVWLKELDSSKPVILVTQGTIANFNFNELVVPAIHALANEDVQVIITGGGGDVSHLPAAPNVYIERYIPYHLVLPRTDVFITNGGYNGVQQALSFGVPIVAGGATEDKPFVNARVEWTGVGIDLKTATPTADQVRDAVFRILKDPGYRERATEMRKSFSQYEALADTAQAVETTITESNWRPGTNRLSEMLLMAR